MSLVATTKKNNILNRTVTKFTDQTQNWGLPYNYVAVQEKVKGGD